MIGLLKNGGLRGKAIGILVVVFLICLYFLVSRDPATKELDYFLQQAGLTLEAEEILYSARPLEVCSVGHIRIENSDGKWVGDMVDEGQIGRSKLLRFNQAFNDFMASRAPENLDHPLIVRAGKGDSVVWEYAVDTKDRALWYVILYPDYGGDAPTD